jgi:hypothetical protein
VTVRFTLLAGENTLRMEYRGTTDAPTPISLINHAYLNLDGDEGITVDDQLVHVAADEYTPAGEGMTLLGSVRGVEGTPADLRSPAPSARWCRSSSTATVTTTGCAALPAIGVSSPRPVPSHPGAALPCRSRPPPTASSFSVASTSRRTRPDVPVDRIHPGRASAWNARTTPTAPITRRSPTSSRRRSDPTTSSRSGASGWRAERRFRCPPARIPVRNVVAVVDAVREFNGER